MLLLLQKALPLKVHLVFFKELIVNSIIRILGVTALELHFLAFKELFTSDIAYANNRKGQGRKKKGNFNFQLKYSSL